MITSIEEFLVDEAQTKPGVPKKYGGHVLDQLTIWIWNSVAQKNISPLKLRYSVRTFCDDVLGCWDLDGNDRYICIYIYRYIYIYVHLPVSQNHFPWFPVSFDTKPWFWHQETLGSPGMLLFQKTLGDLGGEDPGSWNSSMVRSRRPSKIWRLRPRMVGTAGGLTVLTSWLRFSRRMQHPKLMERFFQDTVGRCWMIVTSITLNIISKVPTVPIVFFSVFTRGGFYWTSDYQFLGTFHSQDEQSSWCVSSVVTMGQLEESIVWPWKSATFCITLHEELLSLEWWSMVVLKIVLPLEMCFFSASFWVSLYGCIYSDICMYGWMYVCMWLI